MPSNKIRYLKENFGATDAEIAVLQSEGCSDTSFYIQLLQLRGRRDEEAFCCRLIQEECGKTEEQIRRELDFLRAGNPTVEVTLESYYRYSAYTLDVLNRKEAPVQWIGKLRRFLDLRDHIAQQIETEASPFPIFEKALEEARRLLSEMLSSSRKKELIGAIKEIRPDLLDDTAAYHRVAVDMELSISVLGFVPEEYVSYHFWDKTIPERLEYVSDRLRKTVGMRLNTAKGRDVLNNKYAAYQVLKPLYGRTIRQMNAEGGYPAFAQAFRENPVLVKKNNFQSLGKEVEKIEVTENTDLRALYDEIAGNRQFFILEDLIRPHPALKRLNPDSVNTIRIVTLLNQEGPTVLDTFLRTGRRGAFVDNGGAGGIFVHIDPVQGITDSHGIDERGFVYESHPDHAYRFHGIRMPFWEEALKTAKVAARMIPGARYVGWDVVCTEENRWIIVEGNAMTMYIGQQATLGVGKRKALLEAVRI